jgi:hypothetical protein
MMNVPLKPSAQIVDKDWVSFPGGELEGKRPKVLCSGCREKLARPPMDALRARALCFQCYRAGIDRDRALLAAGQIDTASVARFQEALPLEPVNRPRLDMLKVERAAERARMRVGAGQFVDKRRAAQIAARHAVQQIAIGLRARANGGGNSLGNLGNFPAAEAAAIHAAELQLPESWLPFVVSR